MDTKVNLIMPVKSGEMQIKEMKGFSRSLKHNGVPAKPSISLDEIGGSFSEKLKEISKDNRITIGPGPKLREPDAGLNPVKPRFEKQGGVKAPVYSDNEGLTDKGFQQVTEVSSDMAVDNGFSVQKPVSADNGQTDGELLRSFGYSVSAADEGNENLADVNNQSVLLQLQGVYAPVVNKADGEQVILDDVQGEGENEDAELVQGVDTENKTSIVKPSDVSSEALTEVVKTEKTEDGNIPVQKGETDKNTDRKVEKKDNSVKHSIQKGKPVQAAALFKGTLEELFKQGEIVFGDIITFKVSDKGIFIGGEGDSTEDLANLVEADFLQKLFDVLSETLENVDAPTISDQFRQLLITAIQKAVSDMRDPVKREEEYQQKLVEFLMKFVDAINGKDDDKDKKVALEDDDSKDKGGLLLQVIENLIEAAKKNADDKKEEYTAGIYISAFEIGLLNSQQSPEETEETEADPTAAVEQASDVKTDSYQAKEPVHKTVENAVDVTDVNAAAVNEERTTAYSKEESRFVTEQVNVYSEEESVFVVENESIPVVEDKRAHAAENERVTVVENIRAHVVENERVPVVENESVPVVEDKRAHVAENERVSVVENERVPVVENKSVPVVEDKGAHVVENESIPVVENESVPVSVNEVSNQGTPVQKTENVTVENVQSVSFDSVYKAVQPANLDGNDSQSKADSGRKSTSAAISSANRYGRRVQNHSDEVEELKRLFGIKTSRDDKKLKEKNDILESTEEDGQETKTGVDENQGAVKAIGKEQEQEGLEGIDKSIIESVTLEAIKANSTAVAKGYTPDENGVKQIAAQIISEMLNNLSDGSRSERTVTTLTMTLNPESLGKITMKVSEEAGKISLMVTAHNKETAEILTQRMEAMQQAAKDSGTQLEKYQVVYGPEQESRAGQQNYDGSSKNPYVRQDTEEAQKDENGSQFADFLKQAV